MMNQQQLCYIHTNYPIVINVIAEMELESGDKFHISVKKNFIPYYLFCDQLLFKRLSENFLHYNYLSTSIKTALPTSLLQFVIFSPPPYYPREYVYFNL